MTNLNKVRRKIIEMSAKSGEGHVPSAFSILDILWVLYDRGLVKDKNKLVLSKGHASLGLYVILAEKGIIDPELLDGYVDFDNPLGGHPDRTRLPIQCSTGSLGHGFPMSVGLALGAKIKKEDSKIYAIIGDGECNEGTIWESAMLASHHALNNLYCIVDYNHSTDRALVVGDLRAKFEAFGFRAVSVDGHDQAALYDALMEESDRPTAIVANTIKGHGLTIMENTTEWHHKSPNAEEAAIMLKELEQ